MIQDIEDYKKQHPDAVVDDSLGIAIVGNVAFVERMLKANKAGNVPASVPTEVDGIQATPMIQTDARYRAALRDDETPEPVKRAIRQYFKKRNAEEMTSKVKAVQPLQRDRKGRGVSIKSDVAYKKPDGMSARQFKKQKKARFREFRQAYSLATKAMTTLQSTKAS